MAELKTNKTEINVEDFLENVQDPIRKADGKTILGLMKKVTGNPPKMWGTTIIGFGDVHLKYESGRELDWFRVGFSPRKQNMTLYVLKGEEEFAPLLSKLGKHTTGKGCLYINNIKDVDITKLEEIIRKSFEMDM